jgi:hypothetical protein
MAEFFSKFEGQLGVKLFAIDKETKKCVYGEGDGVRLVVVDMNGQEVILGEDVINDLLEEVEE